jgi:type IV secretion system protein VirD4
MKGIDQFMVWGQVLLKYQHYLFYGLVGMCVFCVVMSIITRGQRQARHTHGSARWATRQEAKQGGLVQQHGYPLGLLGGTMLRVQEKHILQVGGTGSRKDRSYNFPFTVSCPWSMLIVDVKSDDESDGFGENFYHCGAARRRRGPVYRLCPGDPTSHRWNPLDMVRVGTIHEFRDVMVLMNCLLAPQKKDVHPSDGGHWDRQGAVAGRGVLLYALHTLPPGQATLTACHALMIEEETTLAAMCTHPHPEVQAQGLSFRTLQEKSERQFAGEWGAAKGALDLFSDPAIAAITNHSDFAIPDLQWGTYPMTVYLGADSPTDLTYLYPLERLILQGTYRVLTTTRGRGRRRWDLTMLLNEFNELTWMDILERVPAHSRSAHIWFVLTIQDLGQLFETYGYRTPLLGNMGVKIFHAQNNPESAEWVSRMLCDETITVWSETQGERRSRTRHETGRKLLDVSQIMGLGRERVVVQAELEHPLALQKPPYWQGGTA